MNVLVMASTLPSMAQPMMEDTDSAIGENKISIPDTYNSRESNQACGHGL